MTTRSCVFACMLWGVTIASGCSDETYKQTLDEAPAADAGTDAPEQDAAPPKDGGSDAEPPKAVRSLQVRNPYGNVAAVDNLLVDGDFEFSDHDGQYGWLSFSNSSFGLLLETGGLCRSGITCGRLTKNRRMLAYAVAANGQAMDLSLWVKPKDGDCNAVAVYAIGCISNDTPVFAQATPSASAPGSDGWCELSARTPAVSEQPCLYLENSSAEDLLIDDAVLSASSGQARLIPPKVGVEQYARIRATAEEARKRRRF
ncbi:MAG: hypothetical protein KC492_03805 [Myxococcales bacterium]|nr:hypothetical protein [Myxococcales bacterium]